MRGQELYKGKLILYGTGDLVNDYAFENPGEEKYNKLGGVYVADIEASSGELRSLRIVPFFMNRLRLERYQYSSSMWKPNSQALVPSPQKSKALCRFLNNLSSNMDAAPGGALLLEHHDTDPQIEPSGPVLIASL